MKRWILKRNLNIPFPAKAGETVLTPMNGHLVGDRADPKVNNASHTGKATLQNFMNIHNHQYNGIHSPHFRDHGKLRSREI